MEEFRPRALSAEQRKSLRDQALVQAEVNVENARINYRLALAALAALREEYDSLIPAVRSGEDGAGSLSEEKRHPSRNAS